MEKLNEDRQLQYSGCLWWQHYISESATMAPSSDRVRNALQSRRQISLITQWLTSRDSVITPITFVYQVFVFDTVSMNSMTRKIRYYGHHVMRKPNLLFGDVMRKPSCLEKDIVQGCVSGSRSRGRQRRRWTEDIVNWTGLDINTAARLTEDRHRWHHILLTANPPRGRH